VERKIWTRLASGKGIEKLGLGAVDGRIDLRNLNVSERRLERVVESNIGTFRKFGGITKIEGANWDKLDFSSSDLSHLVLTDCEITDCVFNYCSMRGIRARATSFINSRFHSADLRDSLLGGFRENRRNVFRDVGFIKCDLRETFYKEAEFNKCHFRNCKLDRVEFGSSTFEDCSFEGELKEVIFYRRAWDKGNFPENRMARVDFSKARLRMCAFRGLDMTDATFPHDDEHIIMRNFPSVLDDLISHFKDKLDPDSRGLTGLFEDYRRWSGGPDSVGVFNKADFLELVGEELTHSVIEIIGNRALR
jgi:uncharacterized protein YjbI with pentapeptide repeats